MIAFYLTYHLAEPHGVLSVNTGGHTYYGNPPTLTLNQQDPVSTKIVTIALGLALLVGTVDLVVRTTRRMTAPGVAALSAGGTLILFSFFGLLRGLAGIGTAGLFVIMSGLAMKTAESGSAYKGVWVGVQGRLGWNCQQPGTPTRLNAMTCVAGTALPGVTTSPPLAGSPQTRSEPGGKLIDTLWPQGARRRA